MEDQERHERHLQFIREIGLDDQYLHRNTEQQEYPYVLRARPDHREGILINVDESIAELQIDDAYNSYWYASGYERAHIHYDTEGHWVKTDLHAWVSGHAYKACLFKEHFKPNADYDLMIHGVKHLEAKLAPKLTVLLNMSSSEVLTLLTEEPRQIRVVLRASSDTVMKMVKLIRSVGGSASPAPSLFES